MTNFYDKRRFCQHKPKIKRKSRLNVKCNFFFLVFVVIGSDDTCRLGDFWICVDKYVGSREVRGEGGWVLKGKHSCNAK